MTFFDFFWFWKDFIFQKCAQFLSALLMIFIGLTMIWHMMISNRCICGFMPNLHKKILNGLFCRSASKTSRRTRNSRSFILEYILGFHNFNISKMLFDSFTFSPQESLSNKLYNLVCNFALQSRSNFGSSKGGVFSEGIFNSFKSWKKWIKSLFLNLVHSF